MKNSWLFCGLVCLLLRWCSSYFLLFIILAVSILFYFRHYRVHPLFFLLLCVIVFPFLFHQDKGLPKTKTMQIKEIKSKYAIADDGSQRIVVYGADGVRFDDVILVEGKYELVDTIHNIQEFSFETWLNRRDIKYQIQAKNVKVLKEGKSLRHTIYKHIEGISSKQGKDWIKSMLYQIHEDKLSYFITSSGMHISFLGYCMERYLKRFLSKQSAAVVVLICLAAVGMLSVFSASLLRILCFRFIALLFEKDAASDITGKSMCLTLLLFPYMAFELAFLLPVAFRLVQLFQRKRSANYIISLGVMIPFQFLFFHTCDPLQIVLFRILRPSYALLYCMAWLYAIGEVNILYEIAEKCMKLLSMLEGVKAAFYYTPNILWLIAWVWFFAKYVTYHKKVLFLVCLLLYTPFSSYLDPFGEIVMIDVGQGDCTLIKLPYHQGVMLIDVMGSRYKNIPEDIIIPLLKSKGITSIDKVILTHEDYDHSGGLKELQELIEVKEVIRNKREDIWLGPLHIPFLLSAYEAADRNDNSILTYLEVYGLRMLFMGDAGTSVEEKIMEEYANLRVDIIKAGHHGSATSSSLAFLHQLDARIALISAGRKNRYGHPSEDTLKRLVQENILPLTTSIDGGVSIKFCKYFAFFRTAENEFGIIEFR